MNKFKHQIISNKNIATSKNQTYIIFKLLDEYINETNLISVMHSEGSIYKIDNMMILCVIFYEYTFDENIVIDSIEYILNNNLGKFLQIDFKKNNTWKCYFEITNKEMLLQLI